MPRSRLFQAEVINKTFICFDENYGVLLGSTQNWFIKSAANVDKRVDVTVDVGSWISLPRFSLTTGEANEVCEQN
jgi:hypothetical protein